MFSIFKRKIPLVTDLSWIGVDIHSHILPGLDDGSPDVETSVLLVKRLAELGLQKLYATPHISPELYPNTRQTIDAALQQLQVALQPVPIKVEVAAAAEYTVDAHFAIATDVLCLPDRHVLVEVSSLSSFPQVEQMVFNWQLQGYKVVFAHPEHYLSYHQHFGQYRRLKDLGCLFQLDLLSIIGYHGKPIRDMATRLLQHEIYDLVGSNLHHEEHLLFIENAVQSGALFKEIGHYPFLNSQLFG